MFTTSTLSMAKNDFQLHRQDEHHHERTRDTEESQKELGQGECCQTFRPRKTVFEGQKEVCRCNQGPNKITSEKSQH